uniref:Vacuolar protein sorting-associated protein 26A n=1 Tax=Jaculus jaculus TaxID=51337 RepID=A0A8C5L5I9_JACJA
MQVEKPYESYIGANVCLRYFLKVTILRTKIQHMKLQLIKKEITGIGPSTTTETETVAKYEIMDGAPVKGEFIPIRLFLAGYDPTPTMIDVNKKFSVRYFLNLMLVDEEDRRYFKQQEIILWRKAPEKLLKQRTNFHQRFESPDSQAEQSGMRTEWKEQLFR